MASWAENGEHTRWRPMSFVMMIHERAVWSRRCTYFFSHLHRKKKTLTRVTSSVPREKGATKALPSAFAIPGFGIFFLLRDVQLLLACTPQPCPLSGEKSLTQTDGQTVSPDCCCFHSLSHCTIIILIDGFSFALDAALVCLRTQEGRGDRSKGRDSNLCQIKVHPALLTPASTEEPDLNPSHCRAHCVGQQYVELSQSSFIPTTHLFSSCYSKYCTRII